ncbi:glycosyltransferase [Chloroflexota bacterium]
MNPSTSKRLQSTQIIIKDCQELDNFHKTMHALYVANKTLPSNDYRVIYPKWSQFCSVTYALPSIPEGVDAHNFTLVGFDEGLPTSAVLHYFKFLAYLYRNRKTFDFIHYFSTGLILFGPLISRLVGVPCLITVTGFGRTFTNPEPKYRLLRPVYWLLMRLAVHLSKGIFFQNHTDHTTVAEWFPEAKDKYYYIGSAIEAPIIKAKSFAAPRLRVLLVARLLPDKGIDDFLAVAEHLHRGPFEFTLVGPGSPGFEDFQIRVRNFAERNILTYTGKLDTAVTQEHFVNAHILFFPSYGEGMSRVMLEAGFAQVCPVAYDIPANRDLVGDGRGFLVPIRDTQQVIQILKRLSQDRIALKQNARAYQAYIIDNYNMATFARRMDDILIKTFQHKRGLKQE